MPYKEAGMSVSHPPGQSCDVAKLHWTAASEQRFAETKSYPLCHYLYFINFIIIMQLL